MTSRYSFDGFLPFLDTATDDLDIPRFLARLTSNRVDVSPASPRPPQPNFQRTNLAGVPTSGGSPAGRGPVPLVTHNCTHTVGTFKGQDAEFRKFLVPSKRTSRASVA